MADAEFTANEGSPEQLPRGEAEALNENTNIQTQDPIGTLATPPEEPAPAPEPEEMETPIEAATAGDFAPEGYTPSDPDEEFLVGPTLRPEESQAVGARRTRISDKTRRMLPVLEAAASEPGASPELIALVKLLLREAT